MHVSMRVCVGDERVYMGERGGRTHDTTAPMVAVV